jgi:hypothetical protein
MKMTPEAVRHNMRAAHKWTKECCGTSEKSKVASKMKLDKPSKGNADKSPRTAKADY